MFYFQNDVVIMDNNDENELQTICLLIIFDIELMQVNIY